MKPRVRLNSEDEGLSASRLFNTICLFVCWIATVGAILNFAITGGLWVTLALLYVTPFRYFFFDLSPDRLSKRPPELDRSIPLTIFMHYWNIAFPIPQGGFLADVAGFFLASVRAFVNGYGLLIFDTFAFMFRVRNDTHGIPLDEDITVAHNNDKLDQIAKAAKVSTDEETARRYQSLSKAWKETQVSSELSKFDIPIRRYLNPQNPYFINKEINVLPIDDQLALDRKAFLKDHPDEQDYFANIKTLAEDELGSSLDLKNKKLKK